MKRALFLLLAITALLGGCQAPTENRTAAEAAASSARIDAEEKQAAWDAYYERLCEKSLLEHAMDAVTIVYGTVSEIKPVTSINGRLAAMSAEPSPLHQR